MPFAMFQLIRHPQDTRPLDFPLFQKDESLIRLFQRKFLDGRNDWNFSSEM
jgi:hypothetical protein